MGNCGSDNIKSTILMIKNNIRIGTIYVELNETASVDEQIINLIKYFLINQLDILCIQNISKISIAKRIIYQLNKKIDNKIYVAPDIQDNKQNMLEQTNSFEITWSNSREYKENDMDCLLISIYPIINFSKVYLETNINLSNSPKYMIICNINFNDILLSVYTIALQEDLDGINNCEIRKRQVNELHEILYSNKKYIIENIKNINNNFIHIICGNLNIYEIENDIINNEYINVFRDMQFIDTHNFITKCNNKIIDLSTHISGYRTTYINLHIDKFQQEKLDFDINDIIQHIFDVHGLLIKKSRVTRINGYQNFLVETEFELIRKIKLESENRESFTTIEL